MILPGRPITHRSRQEGHAGPETASRPLIGVLCCNDFVDRPVQSVASRFVDPLARLSGAAVVLVPALVDAFDARTIVDRLDGLLLTGSRSNVAASRYGSACSDEEELDEDRDEVALSLAGHMIEKGRPVFGICRGLQELNVLFGGTLRRIECGSHHHPDADAVGFERLFDHRHEILLSSHGRLASSPDEQRLAVNSVHRQGIDRLGSGLQVEAISPEDSLVEAFSARPCGADVLAVQWHPEWNAASCSASRSFFSLIGAALRGQR